MKKAIAILLVCLITITLTVNAVASLSIINTDPNTEEQTYEVSFFPNPVINDYFTINASQKIKTVKIFNVIGQEVQREENIDLTKKLRINLDFTDKGMYLVKVIFDNKRSTVKRVLIK